MSNKKEKFVSCHDRNGKIKKVPASRILFRPSVYGVLIKGNAILLSKQWDGYDFPGGGVERHETLGQAMRREFWEETGLKIIPTHVISAETSFYLPTYKKEAWNTIVMYFIVKKIGGTLSTAHFDEHEKEYADLAEWVPLTKIRKIKFYNSVDSVRIIQRAVKGAYTPL